MPAPGESPLRPESGFSDPAVIARLVALGPEAQGDVDESILRDNLALTPVERLRAAGEAAAQIERLRCAMKVAGHE